MARAPGPVGTAARVLTRCGAAHHAQICLPDWPWWNRHPLKWLEVPDEDEVEEKVEKKKKKKVAKAK